MAENGDRTKVGDTITGLALAGLFLASIVGIWAADVVGNLLASVGALAAILYFVHGGRRS